MDLHDNTFNTICRVCLKHGIAEKMVSLTDNTEENGLSPYGISFEKLTNLTVKQNNYLPTKICHNCKKTLDEVASFMIISETSDQKLSKLISFSLKQDLCEEMVKEVVWQYTLFSANITEDSKASSSRACTSHYDEDSNAFSEKDVIKNEGKYSNIKVEVDIQRIPPDRGIRTDLKNNATREEVYQSNSNDIDIFLYSIEKLVTTKVPDVEVDLKRELRPTKHVKSKATERDFTCNVCHRVLANPATYKHHMERHGVCRYVCDQCGKGFPVKAELTQHQIYRHGIGSTLECDQCTFKAARRLELIEHIRLHTGERPFTCEKCGLTFRRKALYRIHLRFHGDKTVSCDYCPKMFYRRSEMLSHSNNVHDRVYAFLCKVCNVTYAMAKSVRRHMLVKHGIPRNKQGKVIRINKNMDNTFFKDSKELSNL